MLTSPLLAQWKRSTVTDFSNMHEAYRKIPSFTFSFNRVMSWLVNLLFAVQRFFACRRPNPALAVSTQLIPRADSSDLKAIVMRPRDSSETLPILLYYHGGGFVFSWVSMHHQHCQRYTLEANCVTLLVDYRLGPKQPFPDGFEDCFTAYEWALQNAASLNADATRVVVMGDSAGGAFAAGVAQRAVDESLPLNGQALVYPVLDSDCKTTSATEFEKTPIFNAESNRRMWRMYLRNVPAGERPAYASPSHRQDLSALAPAYVETAEFDPLRDEGIDYAQRLDDAGVAVDLNSTQGTVHGYEPAAPKSPVVEASMQRRITALHGFFSQGVEAQG
jgi:acetyl esterase